MTTMRIEQGFALSGLFFGGDSMKFENLFTSGYTFSKEEYSEKLSYILFNSMLLFNVVLLALATIVRFYEADYYQAFFDSFYGLVSIAVYLTTRLSRAYFVKTFYALVIISFLLITFSFLRENNPIGGLGWYFILLMTVVFIRGYREGVFLFLVSTVTIVIVAVINGHTPVEILIGVMPFVVAYFFISFYEKRNTSFSKMLEAQKNLYAYQAKYDRLTKIPNREYFFEHFETLLAKRLLSREEMVVLFMDIDHFKGINDTYGHQAGDEVLVETARRLKAALHAEDILARFGGDEFVVIMKDASAVEGFLSRFATVMREPIATSAKELLVTLSVGTAAFPTHGSTETELLAYADRAMYQAKKEQIPSLHKCY